jgi:ABC-type multidrug transport system ATPase subunit
MSLHWKEVAIHLKTGKNDDGGTCLVRDIQGVVHPGSMAAIMGPSGCGKSTFLKGAMGVDPAYRVEGFIGLGDYAGWDYLRKHAAYVSDNDVFFEGLTVFQTLAYRMRLTATPCPN